jgi:phage shock protein A
MHIHHYNEKINIILMYIQQYRERAVSVLEGLGDVLEQVKEAADQCARVGQLAIKWQKKVDKACRLPFPEVYFISYRL